ncbi:hypothetical protein Cgig2_005220 [Carnegiea gigantea]|uniref:Uncharacterized protein n=1 Tax=Carnegiea gigantea TaxID=171969 RepID=A0A9Q1QBV2_9CARY|nr:hypothetical protein Cgig2_005220 [Carnegiea gigantea]
MVSVLVVYELGIQRTMQLIRRTKESTQLRGEQNCEEDDEYRSTEDRRVQEEFYDGDIEEAAYEVGIPKLVQATFYDKTVSYTKELGEFLTAVGEELANHMWEAFNWQQRHALLPSHPLPKDYQDLYADSFSKKLRKLLSRASSSTLYAMAGNDALELGVLTRNIAQVLETVLIDLHWHTF